MIQYVDDALIAGEELALTQLQQELKQYFQCKFETPNDFLGLDLNCTQPGKIQLSMKSFTSKMKDVLQIPDDFYGEILTPGRTDKKINKTEEHEENDRYRSYVGSLNWLTMGLRYDLAFTTKELSRVLNAPTKTANTKLLSGPFCTQSVHKMPTSTFLTRTCMVTSHPKPERNRQT